MAHISGKAGQLKLEDASGSGAAEVVGIKSWTLDYTADALETTDFANLGVREYIVGCSGWSGSFEGFKEGIPEDLGELAAGGPRAIELIEETSGNKKWTGNVIITGIHVGVSFDGVVTYGYDFQGTGTLTVAAA